MFPRLAQQPACVPALLIASLLLISTASAQSKKRERDLPSAGPGMPASNVPPEPPGPDGPFRHSEVTKKAAITHRPEPGYTEEARKNSVDGVVRLRAVLSSAGEVADISVIKPLPDGLTERAVAAARQIRFRPAEKDGRPVSQYIIIEYYFTIFENEDKLSRKARILKKPKPEYTEEARARKIEGKVVLDVLLHKDGTAAAGEVVEGLPYGLTEKAREAAERIKFTPAEDGGRPVNIIRRVEYVFKLD